MRDAFLRRTEGAIVWAYVVSFSGEEVFKFDESGIGAAFGSDAKEPQAGVIVWRRECGGCYFYSVYCVMAVSGMDSREIALGGDSNMT